MAFYPLVSHIFTRALESSGQLGFVDVQSAMVVSMWIMQLLNNLQDT